MSVFEATFEQLAEEAWKRFEREGEHDHVIYLLSPLKDGKLTADEVPFGMLTHSMPGGDINSKKERAYRTVATMMKQRGRPGYVEIMEMWITSMQGSEEEVLRKYRENMSKYGSLANTPGRREMLMVTGRFGAEFKCHSWKIGRGGGQVWLEKGEEFEDFGKNLSKSSILDQTSLELAGETEAEGVNG